VSVYGPASLTEPSLTPEPVQPFLSLSKSPIRVLGGGPFFPITADLSFGRRANGQRLRRHRFQSHVPSPPPAPLPHPLTIKAPPRGRPPLSSLSHFDKNPPLASSLTSHLKGKKREGIIPVAKHRASFFLSCAPGIRKVYYCRCPRIEQNKCRMNVAIFFFILQRKQFISRALLQRLPLSAAEVSPSNSKLAIFPVPLN